MSERLPEDFLDLFQKRALAHLATILPDGSPHVTPVWVDYDGEHVLVNSAAGRQKDLNMEQRPQVALDIVDPDNIYRYLGLRGRVVEITEEGADAHIDKLSYKYTGEKTYAGRTPDETRRIYKIAPEHVFAMG
jgi:PPOX class probable F420-dependent enzyme